MPTFRRALGAFAILVAACHTSGPEVATPVTDRNVDRGCFALTYSDTAVGRQLPATLRLTGVRRPATADSEQWYAAIRRDGEVASTRRPPTRASRWRPVGADSAVVEWVQGDGSSATMRLRLTAPAQGDVVRGEPIPVFPAVLRVTVAPSNACYAYRL